MAQNRLPFVVSGLVVAVLVGIPVVSRIAVATSEANFPNGRLADGAGPRLVADLERLHAAGLLAGRGTQNDAAPVLNRLVAADVGIEPDGAAWWAVEGAFQEFTGLKKPDATWWIDNADVAARYDVSFLATLLPYDHWAWDSADPYQAWRLEHPDECPLATPIPAFAPFITVARVRLAQAWTNDDLVAATAELDHLAMLLASTDTLVGTMVGFAVLGATQSTLDRAVAEGKLAASPHPWSKADIEAARATVFAAAGVLQVDPDGETAHTLVGRAGALPGVCAGIAEAAVATSLFHEAVVSPWPGEQDYSGLARGVDDGLARSGCTIPTARAAWTEPARAAGCFGEKTGGLDRLVWLPYVRSFVVSTARNVATADYLGPYAAK